MATPKLRFKEFDTSWERKSFGDITSKIGSGSTPRGGSKAYTEEGVVFIRSQNVNNNQLILENIVYIPQETHVKMSGSKVVANDILLNITGASIGRSCVVPSDFKEGNVNQHVCIIRSQNHNPLFIQSFLSSKKGQNAIQSRQTGSGREGINFQAVRSIDLNLPPLKEQTKIATFLSAVDTKIDELTQKHELLTEYKKGMMQQIFSQKLRFQADDGSDFEDWEYMSLHEVLDYEQPTRYIVKTTDYDDSFKTAVLTAGKSFILGYTNEDNDIFEADNKNVIIFDDFTTAYKFVDFPFKVKSSAMKILQTKSKNYDIFYIYSVFSTINIQKGDEHKRRWISEYSQIEVPIPSLPEQTKIANFLTAIDQKIDNVTEQIDHAKAWKKGLLQQMFV